MFRRYSQLKKKKNSDQQFADQSQNQRGIKITPEVWLQKEFHLVVKRRACFKAALSGLKEILEIANPLKLMKNAFYFALLKDLLAFQKLQLLF